MTSAESKKRSEYLSSSQVVQDSKLIQSYLEELNKHIQKSKVIIQFRDGLRKVEQPTCHKVHFEPTSTSGNTIALEPGTSLLTTTQNTEAQLSKPFKQLYASPDNSEIGTTTGKTRVVTPNAQPHKVANISRGPDDLSKLGNTSTLKGGLFITFARGQTPTLRFVESIETVVSKDSANQAIRIKVRGTNMSTIAERETTIGPGKYNGETKRNIDFLYLKGKGQQNLFGWMTYKSASLYVYSSHERAERFVNAVNRHLAQRQGLRHQLQRLPSKTSQMVWLDLRVELLKQLGLRLYAWADLTIFLVDHLEDVLLVGKMSVAGKKGKKNRNDWDVANTNPPYNGTSEWI